MHENLVGAFLIGNVLVADAAPACATWDVEYALSGTLRLTETPFGKGDGTHKIGPGSTVLRFAPNGRVTMLSYSMREVFTVEASAFFMSMKLFTSTLTRATPNTCGTVAEGAFHNNRLNWTTNVRGVRTDGSVTCEGTLCGRYGAPPLGKSPIEIPPTDSPFRAFEFSPDGKTFTMQFARAAKTEMPKQTSYFALTGREVKRTCAPPPKPCTP